MSHKEEEEEGVAVPAFVWRSSEGGDDVVGQPTDEEDAAKEKNTHTLCVRIVMIVNRTPRRAPQFTICDYEERGQHLNKPP